MRWPFLLLGLSGCQLVFELPEATTLPGEADEDGDTFADEIDTCPGIDNQVQDSDDGDGVGDVCDPYPGAPNDRIFAREMFATNLGGVSAAGTELNVRDGSVETAGPVDLVDATLTLPAPDLVDDGFERYGLTAEVGFEVLDYGSPLNDNSLELKLTAASSAIRCSMSDDVPDDGVTPAIMVSDDGRIENLPGNFEIPTNTKQRFVLGAHEERSAYCSLGGNNLEGTGTGNGTITVALRIRHMHVRVDYIVLYDNDSTDDLIPDN